MFICKYCNKSNDIELINILIDQINLVLEMLKESLLRNFANNTEIYEKCLSVVNLFKDIPCNYQRIYKDLNLNKDLLDKETQYCFEDDDSLINAEEIKNIANNSVNNSNYIYDERIGMYYDTSNCYYYDAEKSLYYDAYYGAYYSYDMDTNNYLYHSQIDPTKYATIYHIVYESNNKKKSNKSINDNNFKPDDNLQNLSSESLIQSNIISHSPKDDCLKDEICSIKGAVAKSNIDVNLKLSSSQFLVDKNEEVLLPEFEDGEISDDDEECVDSVPPELFNCVPCIRMIVKESDHLKINSLFIVPCTGATIGREASLNHLILIPEITVSKMHCSINYLEDFKRYAIKDHASQSGTFINGKRIGEAKCMSNQFKIYHGDELQIGSTIFSLHIHPRHDTCSNCEPGVLNVQQPKQEEKLTNTLDRKTQLNNIKKKYGLKTSKYETSKKFAQGYVDRCQERRQKHPTLSSSDELHSFDDHNQLAASVDRPILSSNIGHRLLKNMGWKEGEGLGTNASGITEPIRTEMRLSDVAGLGSTDGCNISLDELPNANKKKNWLKTKQRFDKISD